MKITVLVKRVDEQPVIEIIEDGLKPMQELVGGYIESVNIGDGVQMICNEEGLLNKLPYNFNIGNSIIVGNVFFVRDKDADFISINNSFIYEICKIFDWEYPFL